MVNIKRTARCQMMSNVQMIENETKYLKPLALSPENDWEKSLWRLLRCPFSVSHVRASDIHAVVWYFASVSLSVLLDWQCNHDKIPHSFPSTKSRFSVTQHTASFHAVLEVIREVYCSLSRKESCREEAGNISSSSLFPLFISETIIWMNHLQYLIMILFSILCLSRCLS